MAATLEELRQLAREADKRGDRETATKAMQKIVEMQSQPKGQGFLDTAKQVASNIPGLVAFMGPKEVTQSAQNVTQGEIPNVVVSGANRGLMNLAGLPMETVRNLANLGIAGYGSAMNLAGRPDLAPPTLGPTDVPGTPAWMQQKAEQLVPGSTTYGQQAHPYLSKAAEYAAGGLAVGPASGASAVRSALYGAASGAGAEAGGQTAEAVGAPEYRQVAELLGGLAAPAGLAGAEGVGRIAANFRPASAAALKLQAGRQDAQNLLAESQFRDITSETGQKALLGQKLPGSEIRSLESMTAKDAASLQKLHTYEQINIQKSLDLLDNATRKGSRFGVGEVAGRTIRRVVNNTRQNIVDTMNRTADTMFGAVRKKIVLNGMGTANFIKFNNAKKVFNQYIKLAEDNGASQTQINKLISNRDRLLGDSNIAQAMKTKKDINRAARGEIGPFSAAQWLNKEDSIRLSKQLAAATERDMESSISATFGDNSPIYSDWRKANNIYRDHQNKLEAFDNTVLGKMIGKPVANSEDFAKKFIDLKPEEKNKVLNMLGPNQKEAIARYKLNQATQESIDLSGKGTAGERFTLPSGEQVNMRPTDFLKNLGDRKEFLKLFPEEQRPRVGKIILGLERQADRLSQTGGSANELSRGQSYVGSGVGGVMGNKQSLIFGARQLYADIFRGRLSDLLFTEAGQKKVLNRLAQIEGRKSLPKQLQVTTAVAATNKGQ